MTKPSVYRRMPAGLLAVVLVAAPLSARSSEPAVAEPTNVVLIISDDQHWADYGFAGHPHLRTPSLDRLAAESLVFRRGYVPSSLCCPSLASLITGRYPHEHGIAGNDPPEPPGTKRGDPQWKAAFEAGRERMNELLAAHPLLPKILAGRGYASLQTGKWWQGHYSHGGFTEGMTEGSRHGDRGLEIGRKTMQPAYDFIDRSTAKRQPFFLWYAPMLPHTPHDPPADLVDHYTAATESLHVARYWANVERFDRTVGELLDHLDREGLTESTLVVYVCDNGWIQNPEGRRFGPRSKLSPYDGGLRTPIMLRQPGTIRPADNPALATSLDILPTILAACRCEAPDGLPGVNLLDAAAVDARKQIFGECFTHTLRDLDDPAASLLWRWTVRDDRDHGRGPIWKLVLPATAGGGAAVGWEGRLVDPISQRRFSAGQVELFDLATDPGEKTDLAAEHPEVVKKLTESLDRWWDPGRPAAAGAWPNWRGPGHDGRASGRGYVAEWGRDRNVRWQRPLPGPGASTPVVWGERMLLTCEIDGRDTAICLDRDGRERWRRELGGGRAGKHKKATGANPSAVTDGRLAWVYFKSGELAALKLADGEVVWKTNLQERFGEDTLWWDLGTSPVLTSRAVVVAVMQEGPSYLVAFDRSTGSLLWKHDRTLPAPKESTQSYTTPVVAAGDPALGEPDELLFVLGSDHLTAHDAADGRELWRAGGLNPEANGFFRSIASPVLAGEHVIVPYARGETLTGIRRGGSGDVTESHVAWTRRDLGADVPSPAARRSEGGWEVVVCGDKGHLEAVAAATGETIWQGDLPKNRHTFSSSPVLVDGRVLLTREDGRSFTIRPIGREIEVVGEGFLDEMTVATPVCLDGAIFLRTRDALWCLAGE